MVGVGGGYMLSLILKCISNHQTPITHHLLFFQQFVNTINIVQTIVNEEAQLWDDAELVAYTLTEVIANHRLISGDILDYFISLFRREDAEIGRADA